jgi:hypothetical protein
MARFRTLAGLGLGLASTMMIAAPVFAAATTTTATKPAAHAKAAAATSKDKAAPHRTTHLAKATSSNGKKVTYDCHLAGNKNKPACKG